ncbi:hypothetical protein ACFVZZ_01230 [Streptomyces chartreusis]|uniref:hypothetical protein n=1 Tax=Streptomyces chartreusis TaxID=1969 RepID=UPI0036DEB22A
MLEVQELSAQRLEGREAELAEMAAFSSAPSGATAGYWRWLAPAWAGKTALMAQFALHPPPNTDVLAFFVTARMAGRADRTAFLSALESQLGEYLNDGDVRCPTQGAFLEALQRAANKALNLDRQLLLVVDGLDEDAGLVTANTGYSIAALLPRTPPPGLRLIVAGRTHPPLPGDVPHSHPLRDPENSHELLPAPAAWVVKEDAERNLDALIAAGGLGEELVGFTAAGGGLAASDLAELTGQAQRRIELVLGGSIGRAFQSRPSRHVTSSDGTPIAVYSFAHQELLSSARQLLSPSALEKYRNRLHAWVACAREAEWPPETPEWALTGYPRTLVELQDADRLTALAIDSVRHDRMWQVTGADLDALAEIADAFTIQNTRARPDLGACVRLAQQRVNLVEKTANAPESLIFVWARMGHLQRAAALAIHSRGSARRLDFATQIIKAAGPTPGALEAAAEIIDSLYPNDKPFALAYLGEALADIGNLERAAEIADQARQWALGIPNASRRDEAALDCVILLARSGKAEEAADLARSLVDEGRQAEALGRVAEQLARLGERCDAINLAREAIARADMLTELDQVGYALCVASKALTLAGLHYEAAEIARQVVDLTAGLESDEAEWLCRGVSAILALAGQAPEAMDLISEIESDWDRVETLGAVVEELVGVGKISEAAEFAREAERFIFTARNSIANQEALVAVAAKALAISGNAQRALEIGRSFVSFNAVLAIADTLADRSQVEEAVELAQHAVNVSAAIPDIYHRAKALGEVSAILARCGRMQESSELARYVADIARAKTNHADHVKSLVEVSAALASCGQDEDAVDLAQHAVKIIHVIGNSMRRCEALARLALLLYRLRRVSEATGIAKDIVHMFAADEQSVGLPSLMDALEVLAGTEDFEEMADTVKVLNTPSQRAAIELGLSVRMLGKGDIEEAVRFARQAARCAPEQAFPHTIKDSRRGIARALAEAGQLSEAILAVEEWYEGTSRSVELISLAKHLKDIGRLDEAISCARSAVSFTREIISDASRLIGATYSEDRTLVDAGEILAIAGKFGEAVDCVYAISSLRDRIDGFLTVAEVGRATGQERQSINLIELSESLALRIENEYVRDRSLRSVVGAKARCGLAEEAIALAGRINDPCQRSRGISAVARALANAGEMEKGASLTRQAIDLVTGVYDPVKREKAIRDACLTLSLTVGPKEAFETALSITGHDQRCEALVSIAKLQARSGRVQDAVNAVLAIPDDDEQGSTFHDVARTLIANGKESELLHSLRKCADPFWLETALPVAAKSHKGSSEGVVLLAEALTMKSPTSLISLISSFDVQAVKTFASCLMSSVAAVSDNAKV